MRKNIIRVAVGLVAAVFTGNVLVAQQVPEVTVQASRVIAKQAGRDANGTPIVDVSLSYGVSYAGLDLAADAGLMELEKRVNAAALKACKELSRQYPISAQSDADCAKAAVDKTMVKVHELATAAASKR